MAEEKRQELKEKIKETWNKTKRNLKKGCEWIKENPEEAATIATGILFGIGAAGKGIASVDRRIQAAQERRDDRCNIYDPSLDIQWKTKRGLTTAQALEYQRRVAAGEKRGDVLKDMKVLRR